MLAALSALLTIDLGNTRCKLCAWRPGDEPRDAHPFLAGDAASDPAGLVELVALARSAGGASWIALSSVAAPALEDACASALGDALGTAVARDLDAGLELAVREPGRLGRDRAFAARGALELVRGSAIVLDAGTALTVDALEVRAGRARFLGGAIAPGPRLLADALARHAARLPL